MLRRRLLKLLVRLLRLACRRAGKPVTRANLEKVGWAAAEALLNDALEKAQSTCGK